MNKNFRNALFMLAAGALAVSCADYNETDNFSAQPDPAFVEPYKDLAPVKSYLDRSKYPNMTLGATLAVTDFNKQELAHAAAITNFDDLAFGKSLMSGSIITAKGVMNFLDMKDLLDHVQEIGGKVFGSPIAANANQADDWLNLLTAPIEVIVDYIEGKKVDYTTMSLGEYECTVESGKVPTIVKYDGMNALKVEASSKVRIVEGFEVDHLSKYTITMWMRSDKRATFSVNFSGTKAESSTSSSFSIEAGGNWKKVVIEVQSAEGETEGYLRIDNTRATAVYVQKVDIGYFPDNHRPQTEKEVTDTINYAMNAWCEGLMKINEGRITTFDLIDEALDTKEELENGMLDIKHSTEKVFWQDIFGSENYAPTVSKAASKYYEEYGGDPAALKFFISETGLENDKRMESLKYWIDIWDKNGAKIDGINAKVNLTFSEDAAKQEAYRVSLDKLLTNLAATGKLIRLSNFDIKYQDASGGNVTADKITAEQRQKLADYYAYVIKSYMDKIPHENQAGICKGNLVDTSDPVGLWSKNKNQDWVRTATYKAFCDALSGN
ncbi:MAG: endo-1,4-beta-xylanase [Prevotella sp.]|nr:endo-1,4-beta-xylanase [Prevotella sp.]